MAKKLINIRLGNWGVFQWLRNTLQHYVVDPFQDGINYLYRGSLDLWKEAGKIYDQIVRQAGIIFDWAGDQLGEVYRWARDNINRAYDYALRLRDDLVRWARDELNWVIRWARDNINRAYDYALRLRDNLLQWAKDKYDKALNWYYRVRKELSEFAADPIGYIQNVFVAIVYSVVDWIYDALVWFVDRVW